MFWDNNILYLYSNNNIAAIESINCPKYNQPIFVETNSNMEEPVDNTRKDNPTVWFTRQTCKIIAFTGPSYSAQEWCGQTHLVLQIHNK